MARRRGDLRFLQANVNNSRPAQDLLFQTMLERDVAFGLIAEPNNIPLNANFYADLGGVAAVAINQACITGTPRLVERGSGYVVIGYAEIYVISAYLSPRFALREYERILDKLLNCIKRLSGQQVLLGGDFNAWSPHWGSRTSSARGESLLEMAAECNLVLLNTGNAPTCIRPQGTSIVDLTWSTAGIVDCIREWRVIDASEADSLSDHNYIQFTVAACRVTRVFSVARTVFPRWSWARRNKELFRESLLWSSEEPMHIDARSDVGALALKLEDHMRSACDASTPRHRMHFRKGAYWWNEEVATRRAELHRWRRRVTRARRRTNGDAAGVDATLAEMRAARGRLRKAILDAKETSWRELLNTLETDPWGKPYKIVMAKLRPSASCATESLSEEEMHRVLDELFPADPEGAAKRSRQHAERIDDPSLRLHVDEVKRALAPSKGKNPAPGPDGLKGVIWRDAPDRFLRRVARVLEECIRRGVFPREWKTARLALLPKAVAPDAPPKFRPVCLLNDVAKALERIISVRLHREMRDMRVGGLNDAQYGFREGRSTVDALLAVREYAKEQQRLGRHALAIGLDVKNAFNAIPWRAITTRMRQKGFSDYLVEIIDNYLCERYVQYVGADGRLHRRAVTAGVPQGSVLGPLLWNIAFDLVLETGVSEASKVICYADDTLVLVSARTYERAIVRANVDVAAVVTSIRSLGLAIAAEKTECIHLCGEGQRVTSLVTLHVGGVTINIEERMKYLGVVINTGMTFAPHFNYVADKVSETVRRLARIMPNLRGPSALRRRLYLSVVHSIMLYAAPVWHERFAANARVRRRLDALQRQAAVRVTQGYRTISYRAASILARAPPLVLLSARCCRLYERKRDLHASGEFTPDAWKEMTRGAQLLLHRQWKLHLEGGDADKTRALRRAVLPFFERWVACRHAAPTYHLAQMLTGHGSFGEYLRRIGKRRDAACVHCTAAVTDNAAHTLIGCSAWANQRAALMHSFGMVGGAELNLTIFIEKMIESRDGWNAAARFAKSVLSRKEAAERNLDYVTSHSSSSPSTPTTPTPETSESWSSDG